MVRNELFEVKKNTSVKKLKETGKSTNFFCFDKLSKLINNQLDSTQAR